MNYGVGVRRTAWAQRITVGMLVVGGLAYADWTLQLALPIQASLATSYVSELSANGQPFALTFRNIDAIGGVLSILGAAGAWFLTRRWGSIWSALALLGVSGILEAMSPMRCVITFAAACSPPVAQSLMVTVFNTHAWVSVLQTMSYFFLIVAGSLAARRLGSPQLRWRFLTVVGALALIISVIEGAITAELLLGAGDSILGLVQRAEVTLTALWLALAPACLLVVARQQSEAEGRARGLHPRRRSDDDSRVVST